MDSLNGHIPQVILDDWRKAQSMPIHLGYWQQESGLKLNLGSGETPAQGYINLDRGGGHEAFPLQYPDNHFDEVRASHLLEHFSRKEIGSVLREWIRVLKPGGCLKIAVPNRDWIVEHWVNDPRCELYLFGGQTDENDYHKTSFSAETLKTYLRMVGLTNIVDWSDDIEDTHKHPVSLNLMGTKPMNQEPQEKSRAKIGAILSAPRLGWMDNFRCAQSVFNSLGITMLIGCGPFWGQELTRLMNLCVEGEVDFIVTSDYDSIFTKEHVARLYQLMHENPDADAIVAVQVKREHNSSMFTIRRGGEMLTEVKAEEFMRPLTPITTGHFGLTIIRASALAKLHKPWFQSLPDLENEWGKGHIDEDIYFWLNALSVGWKVCLANEVRIGHLQLMVSWPKADFTPLFQYIKDWNENGQPAIAPLEEQAWQ